MGAVLLHRMDNGTEKPIPRYSQLDKEGLAVIFGIKRLHKYLYGRNFTIVTDHKPLISLFNETKPAPQLVSPRVQWWAIWLRAYEYHIVYRPGKQNANADALSTLPLPEACPTEGGEEELALMLDVMDDAPVSIEQMIQWTAKDATLSHVHEFVLKGWPATVSGTASPLLQHHYIPGNGRRSNGLDFTWIMRVPFWAKCFWCWLIHIQSGWMYIQ